MWGRRTEETESGLWPTPIASTAGTSEKTLEMALDGKAHMTLDRAILIQQMWPTPTASQARSEGMILQMRAAVDAGKVTREEAEAMIGGSLTPPRMKHWPTLAATDYKGAGKTGQLRDRLDYAAERCGTKSSQYPAPPANGGSLNPTWVEWLMGWPIEWTDLKPLETGKSPSAPQPHSSKDIGD